MSENQQDLMSIWDAQMGNLKKNSSTIISSCIELKNVPEKWKENYKLSINNFLELYTIPLPKEINKFSIDTIQLVYPSKMEAIEVFKKLKSMPNYSFMKIGFGVVQEKFPYNVNLSYASNKIRRDPRTIHILGTPKTSSNIITLCVAVDLNPKDYSIENISFTFQDVTFDMKTVGPQDFLSRLTNILLDNTGELNRQNGSKKVIMITDSYMKIKKFITWILNMDSMSERHFEATVIGNKKHAFKK